MSVPFEHCSSSILPVMVPQDTSFMRSVLGLCGKTHTMHTSVLARFLCVPLAHTPLIPSWLTCNFFANSFGSTGESSGRNFRGISQNSKKYKNKRNILGIVIGMSTSITTGEITIVHSTTILALPRKYLIALQTIPFN